MSSSDLPQSFPVEIAIGETLDWEKAFDDYPADEWTVTYYVRGAGTGFDVLGTASADDGTTHVFSVPAATTATMTAGRYHYQAIAVKGSAKSRVDEGRSLAKASLALLATATTYDDRSTAKKIVDAIDAMMLGGASIDQQEYMISAGGSQRMLKRLSRVEMIEVRRYYARIVRRENGQGQISQLIYAQFDPT